MWKPFRNFREWHYNKNAVTSEVLQKDSSASTDAFEVAMDVNFALDCNSLPTQFHKNVGRTSAISVVFPGAKAGFLQNLCHLSPELDCLGLDL